MISLIMKIKRIYILFCCFLIVIVCIPFRRTLRRTFESVLQTVSGKKTVGDRLNEFRDTVRKRLVYDFKKIGCEYPPEAMIFLFLKDEKMLEVWVSDDEKKLKHLKSYPVLDLSGRSGPKLKEGDGQVPEGIYKIDSLNPNSMFHLSIRLNYPNEFDREMGKADGRKELGSDIMIHGSDCSAGCLAMGDQTAEDLFVLAAITGVDNVTIIITPVDFRAKELPDSTTGLPDWSSKLYSKLKLRLNSLNAKIANYDKSKKSH